MRFLADENFNNDVLQGIWRIDDSVDIIRVQDTEVYQAKDPVVLEFAAQHNLILLTHDERTMSNDAFARLAAGLSFPGVIVVSQDLPIKSVIDDLLIIAGASEPHEWVDQVRRLPL
jgi:predicted nuclease of predicted toxin-antitoxin system